MCRVSGTEAKGTLVATSTTFVLANEKVGRRSGQIRLHGPDDFAAMRKAGALTAEALDLIGPARQTRGHDREPRPVHI